MKTTCFIPLSAFLLLSSCGGSDSIDAKSINGPVAYVEEHVLEAHGEQRIDPYYWMRLSDEQKEAEVPDEQTQRVLDYLNAENAYMDSIMEPTKKLQDKLYDEMVGRIVQDDESVPYIKNGYSYYSRYEEGADYPLYCRKKLPDGPEQVTLDEAKMAEGYAYFEAVEGEVSPNNKLMVYGVDTVSRREYTLYIKDLQKGIDLPDAIPNTNGMAVWGNDNKTIFYSRKDPVTLRTSLVYRHTLGTPAIDDVLIFEEKDETYVCGISKSKTGKFLQLYSWSTLSSETRVLEADNPNGEFRLIHPREADLHYGVEDVADGFTIRTNLNAPNYQIMKCGFEQTGKENWETVVPHNKNIFIENWDVFENHWILEERENGQLQVRVIKSDDMSSHVITIDEAAYSIATFDNYDYNTNVLRYGFDSYITPFSTYDYNMDTKEKTLLKQNKVADPNFKSSDYTSERIMAEAGDGTKVPVTLYYKKGTKKDGSAPLLLRGYGSYGSSEDPYFSSVRFSLIDRGFIIATAHVRGGMEMGKQWYEDGKLLKKKNTFTDFIDCAETLIDLNYTSKEHLYAWGGSAGGLLMGAVVNMRPDLWNGVIAAVPFVDVVTTMLDESIPLTTGEYDEWGNPNEKEYYDYMLSYSPYDNVEQKDYPNLMISTGYWDSQVQYWEPAKWCAKLRANKTDDNILIMRCNMDVGHGGASGRFNSLLEVAEEYAFYLMLEGIKE